jgi:hypothetical protein
MTVTQQPRGFWSHSTFAMILLWLYTVAFSACMLVWFLQRGAGIEGFIAIAYVLVTPVVIPILQNVQGLRTPWAIALVMFWLYAAASVAFMFMAGPDFRKLRIWSLVYVIYLLVPPVAIPSILGRAWKQRRPVRLGRIATWIFRVLYISVILALCDCLWLCNSSGYTAPFSTLDARAKGGGEASYIGFGYFLDSDPSSTGFTIGLWYAPFLIRISDQGIRTLWLWSGDDN